MKIVLAGEYPEGSYKEISRLFAIDNEVIEINTMDTYNSMTDAEIIILRVFKCDKNIISRNKNLKMIVRWGVGYDSVDIKCAGENGIVVTNTPGANSMAVAELTLLLILALNRKLVNHVDSLRKDIWSKNDFLNESFTVENKKIGIIGSGNIGQSVAKILGALGGKIQYYDLKKLDASIEKELSMEYVSLEQLLQTSDIITLHIPLIDSTYKFISKEQIEKMKTGTIIINTARGGLIDEKELLEAIKNGKIRGAALDCVENEPLRSDDELLNNSNIIVTPHIGGGTIDLKDKIIRILAEDIKCFIENKKEVKHIVNKEWLK